MKKILFILVLLLIPSFIYAKAITKADLEASAEYINGFCNTEEAQSLYADEDVTCVNNYVITVSDSEVQVGYTEDGVTTNYVSTYVIADDGTVTLEYVENITNGMTEEQYEKIYDGYNGSDILPVLVAKAQGANVIDYYKYFIYTAFLSADSIDNSNSSNYIILGDGITLDNPDDYDLVVPESQFGDYVVRIAELDYGTPITLKDEGEDTELIKFINSYEYSRIFTKIDDNNAQIKYVLVMSGTADYAKVNGLFLNKDIDPVKPINPPTASDTEPDKQGSKEENTKTGASLDIIFVALLAFWGFLLMVIYNKLFKKYKKNTISILFFVVFLIIVFLFLVSLFVFVFLRLL